MVKTLRRTQKWVSLSRDYLYRDPESRLYTYADLIERATLGAKCAH